MTTKKCGKSVDVEPSVAAILPADAELSELVKDGREDMEYRGKEQFNQRVSISPWSGTLAHCHGRIGEPIVPGYCKNRGASQKKISKLPPARRKCLKIRSSKAPKSWKSSDDRFAAKIFAVIAGAWKEGTPAETEKMRGKGQELDAKARPECVEMCEERQAPRNTRECESNIGRVVGGRRTASS